jgi:outer membrane immunogenic protein
MRKYLLAALAATTTVVSTPALAQTTGTAPGTGLRVEGIVGYDNARVPGVDSSGIVYGARVGYDFGAGGLVVGIEGEATDSSVEECENGFEATGDEICAEFGRDLYVGGRVGARVGSNTMVYGLAGYTNARVNLDFEDGTAGGLDDFRIAEDLDGVRVGAGAEFGIGTNAFVRAEYRYSNYEQDIERHQVVGSFGFRF